MIVRHRTGEYSIEFIELDELWSALPKTSLVVTDQNLARHYPELEQTFQCKVIPAGESEKNLHRFSDVIEWLAEQGVSRGSTIIAVGGGVIGDLVGYVASSYMRGIGFIQVPTTLLAQVDSSVGGKVGVDLPQGKNLVGAFHPPSAVYVAASFLKTLDERQIANGMAEVWKYGFIMDASFVSDLQAARLPIEEVVHRCIQHKKFVVENDEYERNGLRATLNYGHTVGHALEQVTDYSVYLHGEAISVGMVIEAKLGESLGITTKGTARIVAECLSAQGLPTTAAELSNIDAMIQAMKRDKKASEGKLAFSLLTEIGGCKLIEDVPQSEVELALRNG